MFEELRKKIINFLMGKGYKIRDNSWCGTPILGGWMFNMINADESIDILIAYDTVINKVRVEPALMSNLDIQCREHFTEYDEAKLSGLLDRFTSLCASCAEED